MYQMCAMFWALWAGANAALDGVFFAAPPEAPNPTPDKAADLPSLSVLVPARNEDTVIGACVHSLLAQNYSGDLQILVLDDHSTDKTAEIVQSLAARDKRVALISGGELLPGWKGKPNALRQLAQYATGEMLLLTDADCVFYPGALEKSILHREKIGADCLSLIPYLESKTFWEHVIVPLQYFVVFVTLPVRQVWASPNPAFAAANGAFLLLPRTTYTAVNGHEPVKGEMAEDIKFAQLIKRRGYRMVYGDGSQIYSVRMYDGLRSIWDGFSKNLFPAMNKSLPILVIWTVFLSITQVFPFAFLLAALLTGNRTLAGFWLPLIQVGIALTIRTALTVHFKQAFWAVLLHPVGWAITLAIGANSAYLALSGKGHAWKGRVYRS